MVRVLKIFTVALIIFLFGGYIRLNMLNMHHLRPQEFSKVTLAEIYTIGLVMVGIAYPVYPEAAKEHALLMVKHNPKDTVELKSDFIHKSSVVINAKKKACKTKGTKVLDWSMSQYAIQPSWKYYVEARTSIALNQGWVDCTDGVPKIFVNVKYPKKLRATFLSINGVPLLFLEEGLFHVLEERKWYWSYIAVYK